MTNIHVKSQQSDVGANNAYLTLQEKLKKFIFYNYKFPLYIPYVSFLNENMSVSSDDNTDV